MFCDIVIYEVNKMKLLLTIDNREVTGQCCIMTIYFMVVFYMLNCFVAMYILPWFTYFLILFVVVATLMFYLFWQKSWFCKTIFFFFFMSVGTLCLPWTTRYPIDTLNLYVSFAYLWRLYILCPSSALCEFEGKTFE